MVDLRIFKAKVYSLLSIVYGHCFEIKSLVSVLRALDADRLVVRRRPQHLDVGPDGLRQVGLLQSGAQAPRGAGHRVPHLLPGQVRYHIEA